jgi:hypothetical protein
MTTADVTPADGRYVTGVVEPESQPSSRTGSAHGPDGGFVAAPPAGRPNRGNVRRKTPDGRKTPDKSQSRRKAEGIFSFFPGDESAQPPNDEQPLSFEGNSEEEEGGGEEEGMQQRREEGWRPSMVTDTLGPKIVQGAHELTDMMTRQLDHWQQLHTLLQASLSERNQLMQTVARQEAQLEKLARERKEDAERHSQHVKDIFARMQREQQVPLSFSPSVPVSSLSLSVRSGSFVARHAPASPAVCSRRCEGGGGAGDWGSWGKQQALEAAAKEAEYAKNKALHLLQQEEERKRADAVAEVAEAAERDKALALAGLLLAHPRSSPSLSDSLAPPCSSLHLHARLAPGPSPLLRISV